MVYIISFLIIFKQLNILLFQSCINPEFPIIIGCCNDEELDLTLFFQGDIICGHMLGIDNIYVLFYKYQSHQRILLLKYDGYLIENDIGIYKNEESMKRIKQSLFDDIIDSYINQKEFKKYKCDKCNEESYITFCIFYYSQHFHKKQNYQIIIQLI